MSPSLFLQILGAFVAMIVVVAAVALAVMMIVGSAVGRLLADGWRRLSR